MLDAARKVGGQVVAAVVGSRALAENMVKLGFDRVLCFEPEDGVPVEAYAAQVGDTIKAANPKLVLASDAPTSRILLGTVAAKLNAAMIGAVRTLSVDGESIVVSRSVAEGKVLEDIVVQGSLTAIFDGEDMEGSSAQLASVEVMTVGDTGTTLRLIETKEAGAESAGILTAARVVGVGMGLRAKEDLKLIEELADAMHAEIACTLPVCDDMRWFPAHRVIGSSHNQIAPELYISVGISGQPQHTSGIRDAKVVVAVNNDLEARIFKNCDYGIFGDLYKVVPVLISAFKNINKLKGGK
jgi:electron transfer flavoprotein alpha subunit